MLEDALQATLPKLIHGVRVADIGQGSEPLRILGVRSLNADEASGTKSEDGDFVNLELAVAYKARSAGKDAGLTGRSRNAHLLMEFYLSGGVVLPVWVELTGLVAKMRLRVQLMPNPPFLSLMTLTLLGQPKVEIHCTPLAKNFLNIMDIPGLSDWLQSAIDMAVGQYVAPRSLNLDLKTLLTGKEKTDTDAIGVVVVTLKSAEGFRNGDEGKFWLSKKQKQGDPYVSVGWGKWGKPFCSTRFVFGLYRTNSAHNVTFRIIENEARPVWEETMVLLVTPAEIHARERLRLQLWDSGQSFVLCNKPPVLILSQIDSQRTISLGQSRFRCTKSSKLRISRGRARMICSPLTVRNGLAYCTGPSDTSLKQIWSTIPRMWLRLAKRLIKKMKMGQWPSRGETLRV